MEKICKNCQYFEVKGLNSKAQTWGICVKPKDGGFEAKIRKRGYAFQWGDAGCADFEAKQKSEDHHKPAGLPMNF